MKLLRPVLLASLLSICASAALAAVHVRVAVDPQVIPQCSRAHFFFGLGNDGTEPIRVRVGISLLHDGNVVAGPFTVPTHLAAGQQVSHEFNFWMPPFVPLGHYGFALHAAGSDGSTEDSTALFEVATGSCRWPGPSASPVDELMRQILAGIGDRPTPTAPQPWGGIKQLYR